MATTLVTAAGPAAAADSPTWCGNWPPDPGVATNVKAVIGYSPAGGSATMRVLQGQHNGKWYAWAKIYGSTSTGWVSLVWQTGSLDTYLCGWGQESSATLDYGGFGGANNT